MNRTFWRRGAEGPSQGDSLFEGLEGREKHRDGSTRVSGHVAQRVKGGRGQVGKEARSQVLHSQVDHTWHECWMAF